MSEPVEIRPSLPDSGFCNACSADEYGHMPKRRTVSVRLSTESGSGGLVFRLCDVHAKVLMAQLKQFWGLK